MRIREFLGQTMIQGLGGCHGLCDGHTRLEPAKNSEVVGSAKTFRSDSDDSERLVVDQDALADNCGITTEPLLPKFVAEDHEGVLPWNPAFVRGKRAASDRLKTEHGEVIPANHFAPSALGTSCCAEVHGVRAVCNKVGENRLQVSIVLEVRIRKVQRKVETRRLGCEDDELLGVSYREGPPEYAIENAEDGGIGANAETEGEHGDEREAGTLQEHAKCVAQVFPESFHGVSLAIVSRSNDRAPRKVPRESDDCLERGQETCRRLGLCLNRKIEKVDR